MNGRLNSKHATGISALIIGVAAFCALVTIALWVVTLTTGGDLVSQMRGSWWVYAVGIALIVYQRYRPAH